MRDRGEGGTGVRRVEGTGTAGVRFCAFIVSDFDMSAEVDDMSSKGMVVICSIIKPNT
jgi:hypothetical protein